jgi:hypothetical protein
VSVAAIGGEGWIASLEEKIAMICKITWLAKGYASSIPAVQIDLSWLWCRYTECHILLRALSRAIPPVTTSHRSQVLGFWGKFSKLVKECK